VTAAASRNLSQSGKAADLPDWMKSFVPCRVLKSGHLQTIVGNYMPAAAMNAPATAELVTVDALDGSQVLCHTHWQAEPVRRARLTVVLVHGLEGSSNSKYIVRLAARAWRAGCNVVRMNMRNCGGTDALTPTLYHSGLSGDVGAVIEHFTALHGLERVALIGYSMGGNLVLRLAGEWGARAPLTTVAAVCPAVDLAAGSDALHRGFNRAYEAHFLRGLMRRFRVKASLFPERYQGKIPPIRSLRDFDDQIVARFCNFRDADDYYYRAAAARVVCRIAVPTFVLCAANDPFILLTEETRAKFVANPAIQFVETSGGGHCAYLGQGRGDEVHWAEAAVIRYVLETAGGGNGS